MKLLNYIQGQRSGSEANLIERQALEDPFLAEALEGYETPDPARLRQIASLQKQVGWRSRKTTKNRFGMRTAVAACALLALCGGVWFYLARFNTPHNEILADTNTTFVLYVPVQYVEQKRAQLSQQGRQHRARRAVVEIENLHSVIYPYPSVNIYLPPEAANRK